MISLFLTGSYCLISARNKIGTSFPEIEKLPKEDLMKLINKQCDINTKGLNNDNLVSGDLVFEELENQNQRIKYKHEQKDGHKTSPQKNSLYLQKQKSEEEKQKELINEEMNFEEFKGTDDFIRNIFKKYITDFLADIALVKYLVFNEDFDSDIKNDNINIHSSDKKIHDLKQVLSGYNYSFILKWITTSKNFRFWNFEHDPELWTLSCHLGQVSGASKYYENGDHYIGDMKSELDTMYLRDYLNRNNIIYRCWNIY